MPISRVFCQKGPTWHAYYAWQIGPFWQNTLDLVIPLPVWNSNAFVYNILLFFTAFIQKSIWNRPVQHSYTNTTHDHMISPMCNVYCILAFCTYLLWLIKTGTFVGCSKCTLRAINFLAPRIFQWNFTQKNWDSFNDWGVSFLLWNCPRMNVTGPHWWYITLVQFR